MLQVLKPKIHLFLQFYKSKDRSDEAEVPGAEEPHCGGRIEQDEEGGGEEAPEDNDAKKPVQEVVPRFA